MSQNKTGILGGTFNPVHRGHVELGLRIKAAFGLERILYILSAQPPHKKLQALAAAELRLAMLRERYEELGPVASQFLEGLFRTQRYNRDQAQRVLQR